MAFSEPKYSKREVSQKFNLKELLGYEPSEKQKELFYTLAVDEMTDRTLSGVDINGKKFKRYSKDYAEKKGVGRDSVDMVLTGEMLNSFEESLERKNIIKIKVSEGENTLKAFNHNVGDTLPRRQFFGFKSENSLRRVIDQVDSIKEAPRREQERAIDLAELRSAINLIGIDTEGFDGEG